MKAQRCKLEKHFYALVTMVLPLLFMGHQAGFADTVSPSPRTRTLSTPQDNYFQQIANGHPYRWFDRDMAIIVLIKPGTGVPNFKPSYEQDLRAAFQEWENNSNSKIKFRYVTDPPANITCQFVTSILKEKPSVAGITYFQTSPHHMDSAAISIKTSSNFGKITDDIMRAICLHEIGHALGLVNHSLDPHDVMFPYLTQQKTLSIRDTNTIHMLYAFQPPPAVLLLPREPQLDREPPLDPNYPFGLIALSSDKYETYTRQVVAQLRKHFTAFSGGPMLECNIRCFVDSTGNIFNYKIFQGSTNDSFDRKALATLVSALPLPPPPVNLRNNKWSKTPIAFKFRSDGWIVPYVEPDPNQSDWLKTSEQPSPDELMKDLAKDTTATSKVTDPNLEPWIVAITQKAHDAWKVEGNGKAEVIAGIGSAGRITHLVITKPSGDESFDNSVLNACMSAEPYPAAPATTQGTTEVNMLFEH